jgi:hypothetical protein
MWELFRCERRGERKGGGAGMKMGKKNKRDKNATKERCHKEERLHDIPDESELAER